jgi:hypothetical protein
MVKVRYLGIGDARAAFDELRPYRQRLIDMQGRCRPFKAEYLILYAAQVALDAAAHFFTGDPQFFSAKPEQSRAIQGPGEHAGDGGAPQVRG